MTLKQEMKELCTDIAGDYPGWSFVGDEFKNKSLVHSTLVIRPGFFFKGGLFASVSPTADVYNKKETKLFAEIFDKNVARYRPTSFIVFKNVLSNYRLSDTGGVSGIAKPEYFGDKFPPHVIRDREAEPYLRKVFADGIKFLNKYYDFSSEENLLRNLPLTTETHPNTGYDGWDGIVLCLAHILLGDFDFFDWYKTHEFDPRLVSKRWADLALLEAKLPELRQRYAEGKIGLPSASSS